MSNGITTDAHSVAPGQIQFYDSIQPPLPSGSYTLQATQQINGLPSETVAPYVATQSMVVDGPRFSINGSIVHTLFPPANQEGNFSTSLPHAVFSDFSLPWSRKIDAAAPEGAAQTPWIGLLTLYPADYVTATQSGQPPVSSPKTVTVQQLVQPESASILGPALTDYAASANQNVTVIDVSVALFQTIAPLLEEVPYLAHARVVNTDGKVMLGMDDDGCFSVVVGNRLPLGNAKNRVALVSYEGHQNHLRGSSIPPQYTTIRLVLLYAWEFTASAFTGSFVSLMEDLCKPGRGGVSLLQMPHTEVTDSNPLAKEALEIGFVPLQNDMRVGEQSTAWYRGPLVPAPTKRDFMYGPYHYSDHAMHYDPEYGLFNHAYSAAWQIGRLLALSDASFATGIFNWRNTYLKAITLQAKNTTAQAYRSVLDEVAGTSISDKSYVSATLNLLASFTKLQWPQRVNRADKMLADSLPGVLTDKQVQSLVQKQEDPLIGLIKKFKTS